MTKGVFKAIVPKKVRSNVLNLSTKTFTIGMKEFMKIVKGDFLMTVKTWKHKPSFRRDLLRANRKIVAGKVSTSNEIYGYLNYGTSVRYATMTSDWVSKTAPGSLGSGAGRGRVAFVNKRFPRPGIKAREFDKQIKKKREQDFTEIMLKSMGAFFQSAFK